MEDETEMHLTQEQIDEFDLLEMGSFDFHALFEAKAQLGNDVDRSARVLRSLFDRGLIEFLWHAVVDSSERLLAADEVQHLLGILTDPNAYRADETSSGYYGFLNTDAGDDFIGTSNAYQYYINSGEWARRNVWQQKPGEST